MWGGWKTIASATLNDGKPWNRTVLLDLRLVVDRKCRETFSIKIGSSSLKLMEKIFCSFVERLQNTEKENKQKKACRCEAFVCAFTYFTRKTSLFRIRAHSPMSTSTSSSALHCGINFAYEIQFVVTQRRHKCMWFYIVVKYISVCFGKTSHGLSLSYLLLNESKNTFF